MYQAILFKRDRWNQTRAEIWLRRNNFASLKAVHITPTLLRYRIFNPIPEDVYRMHHLADGVMGVALMRASDI
jgi:hypothetical protein